MSKIMISVVIIDYLTPNRTIKYIKDFIQCSDIKDISFVIVDNSTNEENYNVLNSLCVKNFIKSDMSRCNPIANIQNLIINDIIYYRNIDGEIDLAIVRAKENGGFAKGNNLGFEVATQYFVPSYVIFSNNDIRFPDVVFNLSSLIRNFGKDKKIAMVGPKVIGLDGKDQSPARYIPLEKRFWYKQLLWPLTKIAFKKYDHIEDDLIENASCGFVYRIIGAFMLADAKKFREAGMFDDHTFLYAEEPILSERYKKKGYKTYYDNNVVIVHEEGFSTINEKSKTNSVILRKKRAFREECYYYEKYINYSRTKITITKIIFKWYLCKLYIAKFIIELI